MNPTSPAQNVLLVGAGAVGISYAYYLQRGGARVSFLVRPKYAAELAAGTNVYFPKKKGVREPIRFDGFEVLTSDDEVSARAEGLDMVWLCMSSPALKKPWLDSFLDALKRLAERTGKQPTIVLLQPGTDDLDHLAARWPRDQIVQGLITLIAYQTPLPNEAPHPDGIAVYIPPMTKFPVRGEPARAKAVADLVTAGGWKSKVVGPLGEKGGSAASAILQSHIVALEGAGWRFGALFKSPLRKLACEAAREGMVIMAANQGRGGPFARHFVRPLTMGMLLRLARWKMPFDFEVYLEYHFMKVRDQTVEGIAKTIQLGDQLGRPVTALSELERRVFVEA